MNNHTTSQIVKDFFNHKNGVRSNNFTNRAAVKTFPKFIQGLANTKQSSFRDNSEIFNVIEGIIQLAKENKWDLIPAGSRRFGYHNDESDYDFILTNTDSKELFTSFLSTVNNKIRCEFNNRYNVFVDDANVQEYGNHKDQEVLVISQNNSLIPLPIHIICTSPKLFYRYNFLHLQIDEYIKQNPEILDFIHGLKDFPTQLALKDPNSPFERKFIKGSNIFRLLVFLANSSWKIQKHIVTE